MPPFCRQGNQISGLSAQLLPVSQDEPAEHLVSTLEKLDAFILDMQAMQVNFNGMFQNICAIKDGIGTTGDDALEPKSPYKQTRQDDQQCGVAETDGNHQPDPQEAHRQNRRLMTLESCTLSVPAGLAKYWTTDGADAEIAHVRHFGSQNSERAGPQGPKQITWDSRWQSLFESHDTEIKDEQSEIARTRSADIYKRESIYHYFRRYKECAIIHPHSRFRVAWDSCGLLAILYDAFSIPIYAAWDINLGNSGFIMLISSIVFWNIDICFGFCTGYFAETTLVFSRYSIALHYIRTWLFADLFLVGLDLSMVILPGVSEGGGSLSRNMRLVRILRLARGLRLLKISKLVLGAEEFLQTIGGNVLILMFSVSKTIAVIYLIAHFASCAWYFIGQARSEAGPSWVRLIDSFDHDSILKQYMHACYWVLGHLCAAPVDPTIYPTNLVELSFTLSLIVCSLLVIGISISKMSSTVAALNQANAEARETKRKLKAYLHPNKFPHDLAVRVIQHALQVHKKRASMELDPFVLSLLSRALVSDIKDWMRGKYLLRHPLFDLIRELHPEATLELYNVCTAAIYAETDIVYKAGTLSEVLYVTVGGSYTLHHFPDLSDKSIVTRFETTEFFCEVSLFAQTQHRSTLKAVTFADSLSLHGADFVQCIRLVPGCIGTMYKYARQYLSAVVEVEAQLPFAPQILLKEGQIPVQDVMPMQLALKACAQARGSNLPALTELLMPCVEVEVVRNTVAFILEQDLSTHEIIERLELAFPEIQEETGIYTELCEPQERQRSIGAMLGLILLRKDSYNDFVQVQTRDSRMTRELWGEWQLFITWADLSQETIHALLVFLGIRNLGKIKTFLKMVPPSRRSPENSVLYLMENATGTIPSVTHLPNRMLSLVKMMFRIHKQFNLAQLMQGENTPAQVLALKRFSQEEGGERLLAFYFSALVGTMCGLKGDVTLDGCLFMDENNARNVLTCIQCLRQIVVSKAHAVYWAYLSQRGQFLGLQVHTPEELTIVRLACLVRSSKFDLRTLQQAWANLESNDKQILVQHFLADGISERAFLLSFLPVYLMNAKNNANVGLQRGLLVLCDLVMRLQNDGMINNVSDKMMVVNLSDVASFTLEVINSLAFDSLAEHWNVTFVNSEVRVTVPAKHWQAGGQKIWRPDSLHEIAHVVKRMSRRTRGVGQGVW